MIGKVLSHYRVLEQIGAGGMGVVYRARDQHLERDVALKVLPAGVLGDATARARFRREALSLSRLNHPNIEAVHDFDTQEGVDFLVLEYVPGVTLSDRLKEGPLPLKEILALGKQLADALAAAHERGVVHRDLKPHNLRVTPEGSLKVLDFGLARLLEPLDTAATTRTVIETGGPAGTPPYMAPEQLRGGKADARTDIYAAGAVLYEMATGQRPFGDLRGPLLSDAILHQEPRRPSELNPKIPGQLGGVILQALAKRPEDRPRSARALKDALEGHRMPTLSWAGRSWTFPKAMTLTVVLGVVLGVALYWVWRPWRSINSLAVLPFANASANPDLEYLSDGITDSIIDTVSTLPQVRVISRYSAFQYKGRQVDLHRVGRDLNVRAVLIGQMTLRAQQLQISAELVDTRDRRRLWGENYSGSLADVLPMQEEIAGRISQGLRLHLTGEQKARLARRDTQDSEAYQHYLKGRHLLLNELEEKGNRRAIALFDQAIASDPGYARAYAGLAEAYYALSNIYVPPREAMPRARAAALEALRLDPNLAEAHAALGLVKAQYDWDMPGAESEFRRALDLNPSGASIRVYYAIVLCGQRRFSESDEQISRARELDPLSPFVRTYGSLTGYLAGRYEQAERELRQQIDFDPDAYLPHAFLGLVYEQTGRHAEAVEELRTASVLVQDKNQETLAHLGHALAISGRKEAAREILTRLESMRGSQHVSAYNVALMHAGLEEADMLFEWLERAYEDRSEWMILVGLDPRLRPYHSDPRFNAILRRMGLPPA